MKFDQNPSLTQGKQISISHPDYAKGGNYDTPKQGVNNAKKEAIVTSGGGSSGDFASGGSPVSVGKQSVKSARPC